MRPLNKLMILGAISFGGLMSAQAAEYTVTWIDPGQGVNVTWEQASNPTPLYYVPGILTDVAVTGFTSTGTTSVGPYSDISWYSAANFGLFNTPDNDWSVTGPQAYTDDELAPVFQVGTYIVSNSDGASVTISGAPGPVPGAGLAGVAALALAGLYARARRA